LKEEEMERRYTWSTREEWAEAQRTVFMGMNENPNPPSRHLSDYANEQETAAAIQSLYQAKRGLAKNAYWRQEINSAIRELRSGKVPEKALWLENPPAPFDVIVKRYRAAKDATDTKWKAEIAARPIDDAAWQKELERRAWLETPGSNIHQN
jgi:hypothetical protein